MTGLCSIVESKASSDREMNITSPNLEETNNLDVGVDDIHSNDSLSSIHFEQPESQDFGYIKEQQPRETLLWGIDEAIEKLCIEAAGEHCGL